MSILLIIVNGFLVIYSIFHLSAVAYSLYRTSRIQGFPTFSDIQRMYLLRSRRYSRKKLSFPIRMFIFMTVVSILATLGGSMIGVKYTIGGLVVLWSHTLCWLPSEAIPPTVLFLSNSHKEKIDLHFKLKVHLSPLRVISLLDMAESDTKHMVIRYSIFRTQDTNQWKDSVMRLSFFTPIIVFDARNPSPSLCEEALFLLQSGQAKKLLIITNEEGKASVLDQIADQVQDLDEFGVCLLPQVVLFDEIDRRLGHLVASRLSVNAT